MKDLLFEPIIINQLEIKNRIYLPAMHLGMASKFEVTDQILNFYIILRLQILRKREIE